MQYECARGKTSCKNNTHFLNKIDNSKIAILYSIFILLLFLNTVLAAALLR